MTVMLYTLRAECYLKGKDFKEALRDADMALRGDDGYKKAWLARFSVLHMNERHEQILQEVHPLVEKFSSDEEIRHVANRAEFELRKLKRPQYYEALGVSSIASAPEIKQAYKRRALELHPDKQQEKPADAQKAAEAEFKICGEALEVLTDEMRRKLYDQGYDYAAIQERVQRAERAAHEKPGCCSHGHGHGHG